MSAIDKLEQLFHSGRLTRREFMSKASALGLSLSLAPALFATKSHAQTPKRGGRLRLGLSGGSVSDTLDPAVIEDVMGISLNWQIRNSLIEIDDRGNLIPELAESWESTPDASQWTLKLRKDVEFHNGKTMDARDVVFSLNHHRGEDTKSIAKAILDPVVDIKADGSQTVVIKLEKGVADFPFILTDFHLVIVPDGTTDWDSGVGTGGYKLKSFKPGVSALTERNGNYWKEGRAHFDEVETLAVGDPNARTTALQTGQIDVMNRCDLKTVHLLEKFNGVQILKYAGTKHYTFPMRTDMAPFNDNNVRLAMKYALDREAVINTILRGFGSLGNDHPIAPSNKYFARDLPQRQYDPDKAKFYMQKAGLKDHTFELHAADSAFTGAVDTAILYKEHAAKAGINIKVVRAPNDGYWKNIWKKESWCACYWTSRPTADWMFSLAYAEGAKQNDTYWKHPRFNKLLVEARSELDDAKRGELYFEMQKIVHDEGGAVIPMFANHIEGASTKLKHDAIAGNWELDGQRLAERWWFA
jgi:peptide/nickel transport system substrate-binding protein